ncbi:hypothetical protein QBC40DRAFT_180880 [Triangularia verruculosa]|uniref:Uncharacterized protein n=1 Tax=Triangularia verruculosa TaxID=2587418 RepID=A0AAN6XB41_9PEZI|nr:hypothetical protein QBC40DRAFT_180880 [Triangularia verruculosa]
MTIPLIHLLCFVLQPLPAARALLCPNADVFVNSDDHRAILTKLLQIPKLTNHEIAWVMGVDERTVRRRRTEYTQTGQLAKHKDVSKNAEKFKEHHLEKLLAWHKDHPDALLDDMQLFLKTTTGLEVSLPTISRKLKRAYGTMRRIGRCARIKSRKEREAEGRSIASEIQQQTLAQQQLDGEPQEQSVGPITTTDRSSREPDSVGLSPVQQDMPFQLQGNIQRQAVQPQQEPQHHRQQHQYHQHRPQHRDQHLDQHPDQHPDQQQHQRQAQPQQQQQFMSPVNTYHGINGPRFEVR